VEGEGLKTAMHDAGIATPTQLAKVADISRATAYRAQAGAVSDITMRLIRYILDDVRGVES
jgi:hypothetical protein